MKVLKFQTLTALLLVTMSCQPNTATNSAAKNDTVIASKQIVAHKQLWKNGQTINFVFENGSKEHKEKFQQYAKLWLPYTNLNFNYYNIEDLPKRTFSKKKKFPQSSVLVLFKGTGGTCPIGKQAERKKGSRMTITEHLDSVSTFRRVVLHEIGHALGFKHEHQHPDINVVFRKNGINDYCKRIGWSKSYCKQFMHKLPKNKKFTFHSYDRYSIMHYTFERAKVFLNKEDETSISHLSLKDKLAAAKSYPFRPSLSPKEIKQMHMEEVENYNREIEEKREAPNCYIADPKTAVNGARCSTGYTVILNDGSQERFIYKKCLTTAEDAISKMQEIPECY